LNEWTHHMKNTPIKITAIALIILGGSAAAFADEGNDASKPSGEEAAFLASAISLHDAVQIAEDAGDGRAMSSEFEQEDGIWAYSLEVIRENNQDVEIVIDAATGDVLEIKIDN
jgi:uncharacterized membrane protein YkoI